MKFRKTLKVLAASALLFGTVGLATACGDNNGGTTDVKGLIINEDAKVIRGDFNLVDKYLGCDLTWTSSNENIAKITKGEGTYKVTITRPDKDTDVTLTATSGKYTKEFKITVPAIDVTEIASAYTFAYNKKNISTGEYDLDARTSYNGKEATITWEIADEYKASAVIKDGKLAVTGTKDKTSVTIQATFTYSDKTSIKKYTFNAFDDPVTNDVVTKVEVGVPYIYHLTQGKTNKELYFAGTMSGKYGATTTDKTQATKIYFEAVEGGYSISFTNSENKKQYLNMVLADATKDYDSKNNKPQTSIDDTAKTVWTWNEEYNIAVAKFGKDTYYLGTYNTFDTISPSLISYAKTSFPLHLTPVTDIVTTPEVGVKYDFYMGTDTPLYFAGSMKGYYGACTSKLSESVPLTLTAVEGGYSVSFTDSSSKTKYVNLVSQVGSDKKQHINFKIEDTAKTVWTWNTDNNTLVTKAGDEDCVIGTKGTFGNIGGYKLSEIKDIIPLQFKRHYDNIIVEAENTPQVKLSENAALFANSYRKDATVTLTKGVTAAIKEGTTASSVTIKDGVVTIKPTTTKEEVTLILSVDGKTQEVTFTAQAETPTAGEFTSNYIKVSEGVNIEYGDVSSHFSNVPGAVAGIVVNEGSSTNAPRIDSYTLRVYKGSEMVITAVNGFKFTACTFDFGEQDGKVYNGAVITISEDGKTVTITCPTEKHFRITAIHLTIVAE